MSLSDIRDQALLTVSLEDPGYEYFYRKVCRWYSTTFHTPLHEVLNLPTPLIFQHYYESSFESLSESSPEEVQQLVMKLVDPDMQDEDDIKDFIQKIESEERKKGRLKPKDDAKRQSLKQGAEGSSKPQQVVSRTFEDDSQPDDAGQGLDDLDQLVLGGSGDKLPKR